MWNSRSGHATRFYLSLLLLAWLPLLVVPGKAQAETDHFVTLYGPSLFFARPSEASVNHENFVAPTAPSMGELILINGTGADLTLADCQGLPLLEKLSCIIENGIKRLRLILERPTLVEVSLNGVLIIGPPNYDRKLASLTLPIEILGQNELAIKVRGFPTSFISIEVRGIDLAPPILTRIFTLTATN